MSYHISSQLYKFETNKELYRSKYSVSDVLCENALFSEYNIGDNLFILF